MSLSVPALDNILTVQLLVAWAGEGQCEPKRLGWWQTDLVDPKGGGDLLQRLLPRTAPWAALGLVREAARRVDAAGRRQLSEPDRLRTIFSLGFDLDEQLDDRLAQLKQGGQAPTEALHFPAEIGAHLDRDRLAAALRLDDVTFTVVPGARQVRGAVPSAPDQLVRRLAAALVPFPESYPLPFYRLPA